MNRDPVGPADSQYNDWKGTVALDNPDHIHDHIYELAGLDRNDWRIVGFDLAGSYDRAFAFIYAIGASAVNDFGDWRRIADANNGLLPVTTLTIHDSDKAFKLLGAFKRWDIHARLRHALIDQGIDIVVERDLDYEEHEPAEDPSDPRAA